MFARFAKEKALPKTLRFATIVAPQSPPKRLYNQVSKALSQLLKLAKTNKSVTIPIINRNKSGWRAVVAPIKIIVLN